ncbi:MAG: acyl carrier protein [Devosia sp.]
MQASQLACVLVARALRTEVVVLEDDLYTLPSWDSLGHMAIVAELESHLGARLTPDQVVSIASVRDIEKLLASFTARR